MDNWESLRRPTHPIPDPTHPTLLFERRGATCVTCHVDIDTRDRTTASFFIVLKDFSGSYCSMISTLICLINNNVTDICHFAVTLCYDTAADIQDILVPQKEGAPCAMCHISHGHVSYGHLRLRSIGGLWGILQKYLNYITLAALRSRHRDCSVFGKSLNNNVTVLSFTAADNQDLLFQITVLTCPRPT